MDFLVYSRDGGETSRLREALIEEHWSYMDRFAESMIARGPSLAADRATATGSLHVLGLPSVAAVSEFVALEPNNRAGVYAEHSIWRFSNLLGHTMWDYRGDADEPRFLVIALSPAPERARDGELPAPLAQLPAELRDRLILYGSLMTLDEGTLAGAALVLSAPGRKDVDAFLEDPRAGIEPFRDRQVHNWEFGGRR